MGHEGGKTLINDINKSYNLKGTLMIDFSSHKGPKGENSWFKANYGDNKDNKKMFYLLGLVMIAILHR